MSHIFTYSSHVFPCFPHAFPMFSSRGWAQNQGTGRCGAPLPRGNAEALGRHDCSTKNISFGQPLAAKKMVRFTLYGEKELPFFGGWWKYRTPFCWIFMVKLWFKLGFRIGFATFLVVSCIMRASSRSFLSFHYMFSSWSSQLVTSLM